MVDESAGGYYLDLNFGIDDIGVTMSEPNYSIFGLCLDLYTAPNAEYLSVYRRKCASD